MTISLSLLVATYLLHAAAIGLACFVLGMRWADRRVASTTMGAWLLCRHCWRSFYVPDYPAHRARLGWGLCRICTGYPPIPRPLPPPPPPPPRSDDPSRIAPLEDHAPDYLAVACVGCRGHRCTCGRA